MSTARIIRTGTPTGSSGWKTGCDTTASLAVGGFSPVWGATMLPYLPADTADWPFPIADLAPHYRAVLSFMEASLVEDDLAAAFPLHSERRDPLRPSRQAAAFLGDLGKSGRN